jgi:ABC-type protease/lipase transport system fused ATPase/permease subunit
MVQHGPSLRSPLSQALHRCRGALVGVALFSLVINLLMLTTSVYMMQVYDRVLGSGSIATLVFFTLVAVGAFAILSMLDVLRGWVLIRVLSAGHLFRRYRCSFSTCHLC